MNDFDRRVSAILEHGRNMLLLEVQVAITRAKVYDAEMRTKMDYMKRDLERLRAAIPKPPEPTKERL